MWSRAAGLTSIMVSEVTRIVVPFPPPPCVYESLTQIMALPGHLNLGLHLFMSPTYGFLAGAISGQGLQA